MFLFRVVLWEHDGEVGKQQQSPAVSARNTEPAFPGSRHSQEHSTVADPWLQGSCQPAGLLGMETRKFRVSLLSKKEAGASPQHLLTLLLCLHPQAGGFGDLFRRSRVFLLIPKPYPRRWRGFDSSFCSWRGMRRLQAVVAPGTAPGASWVAPHRTPSKLCKHALIIFQLKLFLTFQILLVQPLFQRTGVN